MRRKKIETFQDAVEWAESEKQLEVKMHENPKSIHFSLEFGGSVLISMKAIRLPQEVLEAFLEKCEIMRLGINRIRKEETNGTSDLPLLQ